MEKRRIIGIVAFMVIVVFLGGALVHAYNVGYLEGEEDELIDEIALVKDEMTKIPGTDYYLKLEKARTEEKVPLGGRTLGRNEAIIALYKQVSSNTRNFYGQKLIGLRGSKEIDCLKITLTSIDYEREYVNVLVYKT